MLKKALQVWLIQNSQGRYNGGAGPREAGSRQGGGNGFDRDPYAVLGVKPGASQGEIQSAYKKALQQYHPDKVSHLGKDLQDLANRKTQEIQKAYEKLHRS